MSKNRFFALPLAVLCLFAFLFLAAHPQFANSQSIAERQLELERELEELESQINGLREVLAGKQQESATLERDIAILNAQIKKTQLEIRARDIAINNIGSSISEKEATVEELLAKMERVKHSLSELLRRLNEVDNTSLIEKLLDGGSLSAFFFEMDGIETIQQSIHEFIFLIIETKAVTESEIEDLNVKKAGEAQLKSLQIVEKQKVEEKEFEKKNLLSVTKGQEAEYRKVIEVKQKTASEIRQQIFHLFGGGELSFEDAYNLARFAEQATDVRAAFILAVLTQESAIGGVVGANVGRCFYNTPRNNFSGTVMSNAQKPAFLEITRSLGMNPDTTPVSCPISAHGAYGGAMGPAQFMPNTWQLYKKDIIKVTGNNLPNPWKNSDAFVATALYLKNSSDSSSCRNYAEENQRILPYQFLLERCAAAQYYAGGNWHRFRFAYGDPVVERANKFQQDINILNTLALR